MIETLSFGQLQNIVNLQKMTSEIVGKSSKLNSSVNMRYQWHSKLLGTATDWLRCKIPHYHLIKISICMVLHAKPL